MPDSAYAIRQQRRAARLPRGRNYGRIGGMNSALSHKAPGNKPLAITRLTGFNPKPQPPPAVVTRTPPLFHGPGAVRHEQVP